MFNAKKYNELYKDRSKEVEFLVKYLKGKTVLDVGGGTGIISKELNGLGFVCKNVEPQEEMAMVAEENGVDTIVIPAEYIGNFETKFDNVIMVFDVFNFLKDPKRVIERISKNLKGRLIFRYWNYDVRKSGWDFNGKRLSLKRWNGDEITIDFWFPFWHEQHKMTVYTDEYINNLLKDYKIIKIIKNQYTTTIVAEI